MTILLGFLAFFKSLQVRLLFLEIVIPAPYQVRDKLQQESRGVDFGILDSRFHGNGILRVWIGSSAKFLIWARMISPSTEYLPFQPVQGLKFTNLRGKVLFRFPPQPHLRVFRHVPREYGRGSIQIFYDPAIQVL